MKGKFEGIFGATFSVYDEDMRVKKETVRRMVDSQLAAGLKGFYVCGHTGECAVLPAPVRVAMQEETIAANRGRGLIMAHVGAAHFAETKALLAHANEVGADAVASLPPALSNRYTQDETVEYYEWMAHNSRVPVYAYITPVLRGDPVEFVRRLAKIDNIAGAKITIPDYFAFGSVLGEFGDRLNILNGPDETLLCGLAMGADGGIGTTYNIFPRLAATIYDSFRRGDIALARRCQHKLDAVIRVVSAHGSCADWKTVMELKGFDMGHNVFPAHNYTAEEKAALKAELDAVGFDELD